MKQIIKDFINSKQNSEDLSGEIESLLKQMLSDGSTIFQMQAELIEKYLSQLAEGEITVEDFQDYMAGIQTILRMEKASASDEFKRKGVAFAKKVGKLILEKLVVLVSLS